MKFLLTLLVFRNRIRIMKKILTALLTFTLGVLSFNLTDAKKRENIEIAPLEKKVFPVVAPKSEIVSNEKKELAEISVKPETLKPFFDSFDKNKFDEDDYQSYDGWFIADDFRGMNEVWTIFLERSDENSKDEKLVWSAMVLTQHPDGTPNDEADFHSVEIKTEGSRLSFRTNKFRGVEYKFDGKFFKKGKEFADNERVLRGTMQKFIKGKRVAKFTANFAYYEPHCFH